jgi:hypothetical protein
MLVLGQRVPGDDIQLFPGVRGISTPLSALGLATHYLHGLQGIGMERHYKHYQTSLVTVRGFVWIGLPRHRRSSGAHVPGELVSRVRRRPRAPVHHMGAAPPGDPFCGTVSRSPPARGRMQR